MSNAKPNYLAVIGDLEGSRRMEPDFRNEVQKKFHAVLQDVNADFKSDIASLFLITAGDEAQGILLRPDQCYAIVRRIQLALSPVKIIFGLGYGEITTDLNEYAVGSDGPALHRARQALTEAKEERKAYGKSLLREVKLYSDNHLRDSVLNALFLALSVMRQGLSENQRAISHLLEQGNSIKSIAELLKIPSSNVSRTIDTVHFREFQELTNSVELLFREGFTEPFQE